MKIKKGCTNCNKEFEVEFKHRDKKYCSRECFFEYSKKNKLIGRKKNDDFYEVRKCKVCSESFDVRKKVKKEICSDECRKKWNLNKDNIEDRIKKSKQKIKEKYGVDSIFKLKDKQIEIKNNFIKVYGVDNPMKFNKFKEKLKDTLREKHLISLLPKLKNNDLKILDEYTRGKDSENNTSITYSFRCLKCEHVFNSTVLGSGKIPICRKCNPIQKNSSLEFKITDFLTENNIKYVTGDRSIIGGKELDIYIPTHNLAIEINGNYWHTENFGGKDKEYHLNKSKLCQDKGIKLIHIFEDEILFKNDIVFSRLKNKLLLINNKIYARHCNIKEVSYKDKKLFLDDNHIQGNSIDKIRYGLYYKDELVSLMTFSKQRKIMGSRDIIGFWELNRFASKLNTIVVGGFSKLLKHFIKVNKPNKIITYADIRWSGLEKNTYDGFFKFSHQTPPNYWYVKIGQYLHRYHRFSFRKDILVTNGYDSKKTEWEIMQEIGYDRIWDCGNFKYEFNVMNTGASFDDI
jgi:hypothetical protein